MVHTAYGEESTGSRLESRLRPPQVHDTEERFESRGVSHAGPNAWPRRLRLRHCARVRGHSRQRVRQLRESSLRIHPFWRARWMPPLSVTLLRSTHGPVRLTAARHLQPDAVHRLGGTSAHLGRAAHDRPPPSDRRHRRTRQSRHTWPHPSKGYQSSLTVRCHTVRETGPARIVTSNRLARRTPCRWPIRKQISGPSGVTRSKSSAAHLQQRTLPGRQGGVARYAGTRRGLYSDFQ